jgi:hypothetical protein
MKKLLLLLAVLVCSSLEAGTLADHPLWKLYLGEWKAEGVLTGKDGNKLTITQKWKGSADGETGFLIEGDRVTNGDTQHFKWRISLNPATQSYEAVLVGQEESQQIRFEANVSEVALTLELKAVTGAGSSAITVTEAFTDDTHKVFESKIVFTGEQGEVTMEGTMKHTKQSP